MAKIVAGAALTAGAVTAMAVTPHLAPIWAHMLEMGISMGASMTLGAIAEELRGGGGYSGSIRQPAAARQCIYGQVRVSGTVVYLSFTGHQMNQVIAWASHPCESIDALYLDGRKFYGNATTLYGNQVYYYGDGNTYQDDSGNDYSFSSADVVGGMDGNGALGQSEGFWYHALNGQDESKWTSDCLLRGICASYIKLKYDSSRFSGVPNIKATISGKNNIYDPRTGTRGYTNNAALVIADFLCDTTWGLGCDYSDEIDEDQLIAAANICDESVALASGGTEARYTINGFFDTNSSPGQILQSMLESCAGRISYTGGRWKIFPGAWYGTELVFGENDFTDAVQWVPSRKQRDKCNAVRATYVSPRFPYASVGYDQDNKDENIFSGEWQPTDAPEYACDADHGYTSDVYLTADGEKLYRDMHLQFVTSCAMAQRIMKIELMRNRYQGTGMLPMKLSAMRAEAQDCIRITFDALGWSLKYFEVDAHHFVPSIDDKGNPTIGCSLAVNETSSSIYSWSTAEERTVLDHDSPTLDSSTSVDPPTSLVLTDDANTSQLEADGTSIERVLVTWTAPDDPFVTTGGQIQIQYMFVSSTEPPSGLSPTQNSTTGLWSTAWISAASVSGDVTSYYLTPASYYESIYVRIRSQRANGATSAWLETSSAHTVVADPTTVDTTSALINYLSASDKNSLMQSYKSELAMQTTLDATASSLSVSTTTYDSAVAAINTTLVNAGASSTWATTWPDGVVFGPSIGIKTLLSNDWTAIATARSALQSAISAAQAAAAGASAVSTSATDAASIYASVDYLSNADKITLVARYKEEQANQVSLDATASALSVSTTAYDNAVATINTTLVNAGASSTWATTWPDSTTFGPVVGIKTLLADCWSNIAAARSALQSAIAAEQAAVAGAAAQAAAISAAQANTVAQLNTMALTAPTQASWASTAKPSLPDSAYAAGSCWLSSDGLEYQVSADGTAWEAVIVAASGLYGKIVATQIDATNLTVAAANITGTLTATQIDATNLTVAAANITGTLSASKVLFADGTALTSASRVLTSTHVPSSDLVLAAGAAIAAIPNLTWSVATASTSDVYNIQASIDVQYSDVGLTQAYIDVYVVVDGATAAPSITRIYYNGAAVTTSVRVQVPFFASVTGLSAGSHTIAMYASNPNANAAVRVGTAGTYAILQRIY